ncbi:hypothetical protein MKY54_25060 [Paenibacillus sp. FSL P2-0121]|uniref:hypothetical protein n=1 Tax=unclassified Paenibacillus TaxID=185978 RepID=UPI0030D500E8
MGKLVEEVDGHLEYITEAAGHLEYIAEVAWAGGERITEIAWRVGKLVTGESLLSIMWLLLTI